MKYLSGHMETVTRWARAIGLVSILVGCWMLITGSWFWYSQGLFTAEPRLLGGVLLYVLPGAVMMFLSARMAKRDLWAFVAISIVSLLSLSLCIALVTYTRTTRKAFLGDAMLYEAIGRLPSVILFVGSLNTMPDIRAALVTRRRRRMHAKQEPAAERPTYVPPPPTSNLRLQRKTD